MNVVLIRPSSKLLQTLKFGVKLFLLCEYWPCCTAGHSHASENEEHLRRLGRIGGDLQQCSNKSFHFLNAITLENISNDCTSSNEFVALHLLPVPLHQPSTLSLKARHTTAFWWPLYSLLISPVSTHHRRARLSEEAVEGNKMFILGYIYTEEIKYVTCSSLKS